MQTFAPTTSVRIPTATSPTRRNVSSTQTPPRMSMSKANIKRRARADIALVRAHAADVARVCGAACAAGVLAVSPVLADVPESAPNTPLFDDAEVVRKGDEELFATALQNIYKNTGYKVRFVMAKSLPYDTTPNEYAAELFKQWNLGDSDVLMVASPKLARAGFAVGSAVSSRLTPAIAESICNETYAVRSGVEIYGGALLDVSNRLIPVLNGSEDPGPPDVSAKEVYQTYKTKEETKSSRKKYVVVVSVILVIAFVAPMLQYLWYVRGG